MSEERSSGCGIIGFLLIVVLLIGGMFAAGWLFIQQTPTQTQIIIDKEKVKTDTNMAVEKGRELVDQAKQNLESATEEPSDEESLPADGNSSNDDPSQADDEP